MLPRRRKAFSRGLRFAAMMHQHHDVLFRASHVNARLIFEQAAASEESAPLVFRLPHTTAEPFPHRSAPQGSPSGFGIAVEGDELFFTQSF
jgi:hypothetical protein